MANLVAGSLVYNFDIVGEEKLEAALDSGSRKFREFGNEADRQTKRAGQGFSGFADEASTAFEGVASGLGRLLQAGVALGVGGSFGLTAMAGAAFDQVRQVENATFALKAYERDASKVNQVLGELVSFARSDMGVLFQRQELFKAASNLRAFGEESDRITERVKILARGVSLGMTTFDELSQIVGRSTQAGVLTAEAFDQLAYRGIVLDSRFRGAKVSADELYTALSAALPASLLEDRANTIDGTMIRLKSAFRDLGSAILGVDPATSKFIAGGLGDRLLGLLNGLREALKDPALKQTFSDMGSAIAGFAEVALPLLLDAFQWLVDNGESVAAAVVAIGAAFISAQAAAGVLALIAGGPIALIAAGIVGLIALFTFLEVRFGITEKAAEAVGQAFSAAASFVVSVFTSMRDAVVAAIDSVVRFFTGLPGRIVGALGDLGGLLYDTGRDIIQGLIDGAGSLLSNIGNFFLDRVPDWIKEPFKKALGIQSPSKVFAGYGVNIGEGLMQGISKTQGAVQHAIGALGGDVAVNSSFSSLTPSQSLTPDNGQLADGGVSTGNTVNLTEYITINTPTDLEQFKRDQAWRLSQI